MTGLPIGTAVFASPAAIEGLARRYELAADGVRHVARSLHAAQAVTWKSQSAQRYRQRLHESGQRVERTAQVLDNAARELVNFAAEMRRSQQLITDTVAARAAAVITDIVL